MQELWCVSFFISSSNYSATFRTTVKTLIYLDSSSTLVFKYLSFISKIFCGKLIFEKTSWKVQKKFDIDTVNRSKSYQVLIFLSWNFIIIRRIGRHVDWCIHLWKILLRSCILRRKSSRHESKGRVDSELSGSWKQKSRQSKMAAIETKYTCRNH